MQMRLRIIKWNICKFAYIIRPELYSLDDRIDTFISQFHAQEKFLQNTLCVKKMRRYLKLAHTIFQYKI